MNQLSRILLILLLFPSGILRSQQNVDIVIKPGVSRAIDGNLELQRLKYFNLSDANPGIESKFNDPERREYYLYDLEMTYGRQLRMVGAEVQWGNSIREDAGREGYADIPYMQSNLNPSNGGASQRFMNQIGPNMNVANHDGHNAYPDFMPKYGYPADTDQEFPTNNDAAGELAANLLKYKYTDWTRPAFYEAVNEPHWRFWSDSRFAGLHTSIYNQAKSLGLETRIGGPCHSVGYYYKNDYGYLSNITNFISRTNASLDFYSYHIYDYTHWDAGKHDFTQTVTSGLPTEGVFDAIANYMHNAYAEDFKFVGSEHGGYINESNETEILENIANKYFPGSGFLWEMKYREIANYIMVNSSIANSMTFMNNPHIVLKGVPFILLETFGWDPRYYSSMLVANNYTDNSNWYETRLVDFYKFFKDIEGRRVYTMCADPDIIQMAFVRDNKLYLALHNQSFVDADLNLDFDGFSSTITDIKTRSYGRLPDFRPYFSEQRIPDLGGLVLEGRGSMVLIITYDEDVKEETVLNEIPRYGDKVSVQFTGSTSIDIALPDHEDVQYAVLRVGVSRDMAHSREVDISVNGTALEVPLEDCAERLTGSGEYASTKIVRVDTALLQANNNIVISFPDGQSGGIGAAVLRAAYLSSEPVDSILLTDHEISIFSGEQYELRAIVLPEVANNKTINWSTGDADTAMVSETGTVTGVNSGSTWVYATTVDGGFIDSCRVIVSESPPLESWALKTGWTAIYADDEGFTNGTLKELAVDDDPNTYWHTEWIGGHKPLPHEIWVDMGAALTFDRFIYTPRQDPWGPNAVIGDYELYASNDTSNWGAAITSGSFSWDTGEPDYYKEIQFVDLGSNITARYFRLVALTEHQNNPEITTSCAAELDVSTAATGISIADTLSIVVTGSANLKVTSLPLGGLIEPYDLSWRSSDESVVRVKNGLVEGLNVGTADVIVQSYDGGFSDTCRVLVNYVAASEIVLSEDSLELGLGNFTWLTANVMPENALYRTFSWRSEDTTVATVRHGFVRAVGLGRASIIVESADGGFTDTCKVNVMLKAYNVKFTILEKTAGTPLPGAMVVFSGDTAYADQAGIVQFDSLDQGTHSLLVQSTHYQIYSQPAFNLSAHVDMDILLEPTLYNISLLVIEEERGTPVYKAIIDYAGRQAMTDPEGMALISLPYGEHPYRVSEPYFLEVRDSLIVNGDTALTISIVRLLADARFTVYGAGEARVGDALVEIGSQSILTNTLGLATFTELKVDTLYHYSISKDGFNVYAGDLLAKQDTAIKIYLAPLAIGSIEGTKGIRFYPNPAGEQLWIELGLSIGKEVALTVMDITGRKLIIKSETGIPGENRFQLDLSGLRNGAYLLSVDPGNGSHVFRLHKQ